MGRQTPFTKVPTADPVLDRLQDRLVEAMRVLRQSPQQLVTAKGSLVAASGNGSPVEHKASATDGLPLVTRSTATTGLAYEAVSLSAAVSGVLPIANGGTNSGTALTNGKLMIASGSAIVEGPAGTTTTVLHGNAAGNPTYAGIALADFVANLGTTTQVLHGNAAGQPTYAAVSLTADVSGTLPIGNGGTNSASALSGHRTIVSNASAIVEAVAGTSGQLWQSAGSGADPAWAGETAWTALSSLYVNSWVDFGGVQMAGGYMKDANGFVHLRGLIKSGVAATVATLPLGYRPSASVNYAIPSNNAFGNVSINSGGVIGLGTFSNVSVALDGITFDTR